MKKSNIIIIIGIGSSFMLTFGFLNLKKFFVRDENMITHTDNGSHGPHWHTLFGGKIDKESRIINVFETDKGIVINNSLSIITNNWMRGVIVNNTAVTGFPYLKGSQYEEYRLASILEWSHSENLEAIIKVSHTSGCGLSFFATDYALNSNQYKHQKNLSINIIGLIYEMNTFDMEELNESTGNLRFSEDYCGYVPYDEDEINFIGRIQNIRKHSLGDIHGHLIAIHITPDFSMDFFIADTNLSIKLENNALVNGIAWIQGTLET